MEICVFVIELLAGEPMYAEAVFHFERLVTVLDTRKLGHGLRLSDAEAGDNDRSWGTKERR